MTAFDQQWWEERYRSAAALFSGQANAQLVAEVSDLQPGRALDAGCGEGGDALWLAERGWDVMALDISTVALDRAAAEAERRGLAGRIRFEQADLTGWTPTGRYDLVCASFLHPAGSERQPIYAKLAGAVATGGTLLLIQHDPSEGVAAHPDLLDRFATPGELAAGLNPALWDIVTAATRGRTARRHEQDGEATVYDAVLMARRH